MKIYAVVLQYTTRKKEVYSEFKYALLQETGEFTTVETVDALVSLIKNFQKAHSDSTLMIETKAPCFLLYGGSRHKTFRALSLRREEDEKLWGLLTD